MAASVGRRALSRGFYCRPTIFTAVHSRMQIAQEEIFGPVLAFIPYDSVDEAVDIANDTVYGLGAHVQGTDLGAARAVAARIRVRAGAHQLSGLEPACPLRWLQALGKRPRIRHRRSRGVPGNQSHSWLPGCPAPATADRQLSSKTLRIAQEQS